MRGWRRDITAGKIAAFIVAVLLVALLAAYMGLCVWVQRNGRLLPGTVAVDIRGETAANLGELSRQEAVSATAEAMSSHLEDQGLTLLYGDGRSTELSGSMIASSAEAAVDIGFAAKKSQPNWKLGLLWLGVLKDSTELPLSSSILTPEGEAQVKKIISSIADELYVAPIDFTYEIGTEAVTVTPGVDGAEVDAEALLEAVREALEEGRHTLQVETQPVPGAELTGQALQKLVRVEPKSAGVDEEGKLVPAVVGLSVNAAKAQAVLDASGTEGPYSIPLEFTVPAPTEDDSMFYKDMLAQFTSGLSEEGVAAVSACDGKVLQPGELFSFLDVVGEVTDGSLDQAASLLYYCAVHSNLSIVERTSGVYAPGYIENGLDAAVASPFQDLKIRNSTGFPIKIAASVSGSQSTVQFYGSNPDGIRVETQQEVTFTTEWVTVYEADTSVRRGSTTESVSPLEGCVVEIYRCVYDADGKLLSRTLENTSSYEKRDQVVRYNPADSGPWGAGVTTPSTTSRPSTSRPVTTPTPTPTPAPAETPTPTETPATPERPPETSMPSWLQTDDSQSNAPTDETTDSTDASQQGSLPDWLQ